MINERVAPIFALHQKLHGYHFSNEEHVCLDLNGVSNLAVQVNQSSLDEGSAGNQGMGFEAVKPILMFGMPAGKTIGYFLLSG